ncbi:VOC family protein [Silvibacterium sp.]|uniref:VOC family protein n=1 Tax=Silvibacterium sp. TaxID=1964179 RepID=UPI0039E5E943
MPASRDILIQVEDVSAAASFYVRTLGLTEFLRTPLLIGLEAGALRLYLEQGPPLGPVLEFFVPDLEAAKADVRAAGGDILDENPAIPRCYVRDAFGLVYNLAERKLAEPAPAEEIEAEGV